MDKLIGILGIFVLLGIAYLMSSDKSKINSKTVLWGLGLQLLFALFILKSPLGNSIFSWLNKAIKKLVNFTEDGYLFLFESFIPGIGLAPGLNNFAFTVLPTIIFFSALMSVLYYFGIIQLIIQLIAKIMQKTMGTSGSESLSVSGNIFVGQTEAPFLVLPFIKNMTISELAAVMIGGFATCSGGILAVYVLWFQTSMPNMAGHLLAASVMSAPAALAIAKIIFPETGNSETMGGVKIKVEKTSSNALEALVDGATSGLKLAANVAAMLVAFVSMVALFNYILSFTGTTMEEILGLFFKPLAWTMGVPWSEAEIMGTLMGEKVVFTELIAYGHLNELIANGAVSERTAIIASYALCGFANFGSIGIQIGGIGGLCPNRKKDIAKIALKCMIGGAIASWLTATIAGILI